VTFGVGQTVAIVSVPCLVPTDEQLLLAERLSQVKLVCAGVY